MYCMNNKEYIIDEADLSKLKSNSEKMLVQLKQVIVHPSSVIAIEPMYINYRPQTKMSETGGAVLLDPIPPPPLPDAFKDDNLQLQ